MFSFTLSDWLNGSWGPPLRPTRPLAGRIRSMGAVARDKRRAAKRKAVKRARRLGHA